MVKKFNKKRDFEYGAVVRAKHGEHPDKLVARFKRMCKNSGLQKEIRERYLSRFVSKSEIKRRKKNLAKRRILKDS